jgi:hypothetical protein
MGVAADRLNWENPTFAQELSWFRFDAGEVARCRCLGYRPLRAEL